MRRVLVVALVGLAGCESWVELASKANCCSADTLDAGPRDAGDVDAGFDAGALDAGSDAGFDAGFDAGLDAGFDAGSDAGSADGGSDDAGLDAGMPARCELAGLQIPNARLTPAFAPAVSSFQAEMPFANTTFTLIAWVDAGIVMRLADGGELSSGVASAEEDVPQTGITAVPVLLVGGPCPVTGREIQVNVSSRDRLFSATRELSIDPAQAIDNATLGRALAFSGGVVLVGAPREDAREPDGGLTVRPDGGTIPRAGRAYLFERSLDGGWGRKTTLLPPIPHVAGEFGSAVAMWGDTLAIGEPEVSLVHVFERASDGGWELAQSLQGHNTQSSAASNDSFGSSLAMSGGILVAGAPHEDNFAAGIGPSTDNEAGDQAGAVYVFSRDDSGWSETEYLKPDVASMRANFGSALAYDGTRLVVGAPGEETNNTGINPNRSGGGNVAYSGAVFVFERAGATWSQTVWAKGESADSDDRFGDAVALWGARVVVGVPGDDSSTMNPSNNSMTNAGAAYVLSVEVDGGWGMQYLKPFGPSTARFGAAVGIWDDVIWVGGPDFDQAMTMRGAAWVFSTNDDRTWTERARMLSPASTNNQQLGHSLIVMPNSAVVCAPNAAPQTQGACWEFVYQSP